LSSDDAFRIAGQIEDGPHAAPAGLDHWPASE
jgi:hypothetical protein